MTIKTLLTIAIIVVFAMILASIFWALRQENK